MLKVILGAIYIYIFISRPRCINYYIRPHLSHSSDGHLGFQSLPLRTISNLHDLCIYVQGGWPPTGQVHAHKWKCWIQGTHAAQLCFPSNASYTIFQILLPKPKFSLLHRLKQNVIWTLFSFCQIVGYKGIHCGLTCISLVTH